MELTEDILIRARKRLDDARLTLQHIAITNAPVTDEQREVASTTKALADLEYSRAYSNYHAILEEMSKAS